MPGRRPPGRGAPPGARRPPPPQARPPTSRRRKWARRALLALLLLLLLWWLWPRSAPAPVVEAPPPPPPSAPEKPPEKTGGKATVTVTPTPKKPVPPPTPFSSALLKAAILARSDELNTCEMPPGSPPRLTTKIRIAKAGPVRGVSFANADPIPAPLSECVRRKMREWTFAELKLPADVDVLVTFRLGGG